MQQEEDKHRFSQLERIKSNLTIKDVMENRLSVSSYPVKCFCRLVDAQTASMQVAVVVPKRRYKHAVDRNRGKRLMREAFRQNKQILRVAEGKTLQMCWVYVGKEILSFREVNASVQHLFEKIQNTLFQ